MRLFSPVFGRQANVVVPEEYRFIGEVLYRENGPEERVRSKRLFLRRDDNRVSIWTFGSIIYDESRPGVAKFPMVMLFSTDRLSGGNKEVAFDLLAETIRLGFELESPIGLLEAGLVSHRSFADLIARLQREWHDYQESLRENPDNDELDSDSRVTRIQRLNLSSHTLSLN